MHRLRRVMLFTAAAIFSLCLLCGSAYASTTSGVVRCSGYLNVRQSASLCARIINKVYPNTQVSIVGSSNGWYKITHGSIKGWVSARYISKVSSVSSKSSSTSSSTGTTGVVRCTGYLNVRQSASSRARVLSRVYPNTQVSITSSSNGWYKIAHGSIKGWVSAAYISKKVSSISSRGSSTSDSTDANRRAEVVEYALRYLGVRYVYGGESPNGFDCSGLTSYVYSRVGIGLYRTASSQALEGISVSKSNLEPGDLVFFDTNGGHNDISHVGIYIGSGRFINAVSGSPYCVTVDSLSESYFASRYMEAKRIIY